MYKVHGFLDGKQVVDLAMHGVPRVGDTVRLAGEKYVKVTGVVWCLDENNIEGDRVNIGLKAFDVYLASENQKSEKKGAKSC